jgi:hypothetical protein
MHQNVMHDALEQKSNVFLVEEDVALAKKILEP